MKRQAYPIIFALSFLIVTLLSFSCPALATNVTTAKIAAASTITVPFQNPSAVSGMEADNTGQAFDWGMVQQGASLQFTLTIAQAGIYQLNFLYASPRGGTGINIMTNDKLNNSVGFIRTGSWATYKPSAPVNIYLPAGRLALQLVAQNGGFNLGGISLSPVANGTCGAADNQASLTVPSTGLCSTGMPSSVAGSGPWSWNCEGQNGGTSQTCAALMMTNGACGAADGTALTAAPKTGLCAKGTVSAISGTGPWAWDCKGVNNGASASCAATVMGLCGPVASGSPATMAAAIAARNAAIAAAKEYADVQSDYGKGQTTMTALTAAAVQAANSTVIANTYAPTGDPQNPTGYTYYQTTAPTTGLCSAGAASAVSGTGPWSWTCGSGDAAATCSSMRLYTLTYPPTGSAAQQRTFSLHTPPGYNADKTYPLMIVLHGVDGSAENMETTVTGFNAVADINNFIVAYLNAAPYQMNQAALTPNAHAEWVVGASSTEINDTGFITQSLVPALQQYYKNIDTKHIYVSGYADGAEMAKTLVCQKSNIFAGIGIVASTNEDAASEAQCAGASPSGQAVPPVSMVIFHGTADAIIPYTGDAGCGIAPHATYSAPVSAQFWQKIDQCGSTLTMGDLGDTLAESVDSAGKPVTRLSPDDSVQAALGCAKNANGGTTSVSFYTIMGGGHTWPGGGQMGSLASTTIGKSCADNVMNNLGPVSQSFNASAIIYQTLSNPNFDVNALQNIIAPLQ